MMYKNLRCYDVMTETQSRCTTPRRICEYVVSSGMEYLQWPREKTKIANTHILDDMTIKFS